METENPRSVGIVNVNISSLAFEDNIGFRQVDQAIVNRLERVLSVVSHELPQRITFRPL
jgi:hypothetical protein